MTATPLVQVLNVSKRFESNYGSVSALEGVNFTVEQGTLVCVLGPSGCGKSTLLRIILGLTAPTAGRVYIDKSVNNSGTAYVQQSALLLPWRTVLQNAALGLELRSEMTDDRIRNILSEVEGYGLSGFEHSLADELSGGMRQRVALIRALEANPQLLLCDEPFSAIDFAARLRLNSLFKRMCRVRGITTIFVTHNIEEAIFLGDKVAVMSRRPGRIINEYTPMLSVGQTDAVRAREAPEFGDLFARLWRDLDNGR